MRTGASCVAKYGGLTSECNSAEVRYVVGQENSFKYWVRKCKEHGIYLIANIDQYKDRDFHYPLSLQRLQDMIDIMIDEGFDKRTARITVDNEPMKYISVAEYISNVNSVIKYVGGDWYIGAGNEEFNLASSKGNMYQILLDNCNIDYLDIHIQSSVVDPKTGRVDPSLLKHYVWQARDWADTYQVDLSCTEANWLPVNTAEGFSDLMMCREEAYRAGCEDFNIVFIVNNLWEKYRWITFIYNGHPIDNWSKLRAKMIEEKKEDDLKLEEIYKEGSKGTGVYFIQMVLNEDVKPEPLLAEDGIWGPKTDSVVLDFQQKYNLATYEGAIGPNTFQFMIKKYPGVWDRFMYLNAIGKI